jgi:hypothetical protein
MIIVRSIMNGKFGTGGMLAGLLAESMESIERTERLPDVNWRVLTDLAGNFDTVTIEVEIESLAAWDSYRTQLFAMPEFAEAMAQTGDMVVSGRQEFLHVEAKG